MLSLYLKASNFVNNFLRKVWDLRAIRDNKSPLANFKYHKGPVTSIEWAPHDESVICLSSADNQVTVWDLSVEADDEPSAAAADPSLADFPAQLLFIHQGQSNVKEIHFHPQIPGVIMTTAEDGFNIFKPAISVSSS
jgi:ribosome assembly protein RRB1